MDVASALTAAGTIGAVVVALGLGLRQRADALEAQYDALRPVVAPDNPLVRHVGGEGRSDVIGLPLEHPFNLTGQSNLVRLTNVGAGVAMNVRGAVFGPPPTLPGGMPPPHHSLSVVAPLLPGVPLEVIAYPAGLTVQGSNQIRPGETLYAPAQGPLLAAAEYAI